LPIFLFSFYKERKEKTNSLLYVSLGGILLFSTVIEQNFFKREYFGVFKEINQAVIDLQNKFREKNIATVLNTSDKKIFDFYFQRKNENPSYDFFIGSNPDFPKRILDKIDSCETEYFLYGWSNFRSPYEIPELIKRKFPCIAYDEKHFNSQITLFKKSDSCKRDTVFYSSASFEKENKKIFEFDSTKTDSLHFYNGKHSLRIEPKNEFCITLKTSVKNLFRENNIVNASAWIFPSDTFNLQMVIDIGSGKDHSWRAVLLKPFIPSKGKWQEVFASFELPDSAFPDDEVKIYLWNTGKNNFYLDDFTVSSFKDSKYNYYETSYRK
jgi:hypothetical protein